MKVKRFNNLWAMGLLLCGVILVALYFTKLLFPRFIVGIAEIPSIVKFGNYVDTHKWACYLFNGQTSFFILYFYICASCRIRSLKLLEVAIVVLFIITSYVIETLLPTQSFVFNNISYIALTLIVAVLRKVKDYKIFYSSAICFIVTSIAQSLSLDIRGIVTIISYPNTATYFVLLIDLYIWTVLLYLYFNYKGEKENG